MSGPVRVLLVSTNPLPKAAADSIAACRAESLSAAHECLRQAAFDVIVAELPLPGTTPEEVVEELLPTGVPLIVSDAGLLVRTAARLVRAGAAEVLAGESWCEAALAAAAERRTPQPRLREPWASLLVGESQPIQQVVETIRLASARRATVLITGETGTGKELAARALHMAGGRARGPFVPVNCGAVPAHLLEDEMFGHVRGAFTGAVQSRTGYFESANGGTLFLDEIGELAPDLQAKLLRVLQEKEMRRLGSCDPVRLDIRVVAATNASLGDLVAQGRFREDLYYRLHVVHIHMPALRERPSDIPLLARHFVAKICRAEGIPDREIAPETLDLLTRYPWPGNVRQLENAIESAIALSGERRRLYASDFAEVCAGPMAAPMRVPLPESGLDFESTVNAIERSILEQALERTRGNKKMAADMLKLKRTTLSAKLRSLTAA